MLCWLKDMHDGLQKNEHWFSYLKCIFCVLENVGAICQGLKSRTNPVLGQGQKPGVKKPLTNEKALRLEGEEEASIKGK